MVRETRHLWVGNLPDSIREDRIREHFKRYGRVQNVKLLGRTESASAGIGANGASGICATVAFMDIKSASKAHNTEHVLDERTLTTEYYEPAAIPSTAGAPSAGSSPAGSGYSGSSSSVNSVPAPSSAPRYHLSGGEDSSGATTCPIAASAAAPANWRGTNDSATEYCRRGNTPATYGRYQRNNTTAPLSTPPSNVERTTPHNRWYASSERAGATGGESTPSTPGEPNESGRRRRNSGSASSRSDSSSPEPSDTSRASTPPTQPPLSHHNNHRTPTSLTSQWASTASGRPLAICVRNLPTRSTDSSLKDGLYHEYKKHGKVVWVKVVGQNADRYAVVRFKKPSDVEKALEVSQDKLFFGCKISVAPHQSGDDDAESAKPYETDIDEYHPKATRTLFIGNLEKDVTQQQLREKFKHFGRIIEIDIKKGSGGGAGYAFCQYASISSVVEAIRAMDGEYVGGSRVKLGFGKPVATACVWVDGLTEHTEKQVLGAVSRSGAATSVCVDRAAGAALVHFEQAADAGSAVRELRRVAGAASAAEPDLPRLCVDYASRECQDAFYEQLEKHGGSAALAGSERLTSELTGRYLPSTRHDSLRFEGSRSRASSFGRSCSRTPRYSAAEPYDPVDYAADRRYRVYDEPGTSPQLDDTVTFEDRLQSVVASPHRARRHRRDSSNEDRRHSKERLLSGPRSVVRGGRERQRARRRRRHRREGSGSRAGTPLRDELDAPPAEPRRPPRDRPALPMCLPLPKFAAQIPRAAPPAPRPAPPPAPDSPPRPPSASSSSAGSAPHSPSLEERIRSLDEKYEKWSGSRVQPEVPDRARLRHRLLEVDINEVKPSEVVLSLLAKRSVFDEDSERLEVSARAPSPPDTPRSRSSAGRHAVQPGHAATPSHAPDFEVDPRLRRLDRYARTENSSNDYVETRGRPRTPSTDRSQQVSCERRSPSALIDGDLESRSQDSASGTCDAESKSSFDTDEKDTETRRERSNSFASDSLLTMKSEGLENIPMPLSKSGSDGNSDEDKRSGGSQNVYSDETCARDVMDMILKKVENDQKFDATFETTRKLSKYEFRKDPDQSKIALDRENRFRNIEKSKKVDCTQNQLFELNFGIKELIEHELQNHINESLTAQSIEDELQNHINESIISTVKPSKDKSDNHSCMKLNEKDKSSQGSQIFRKSQFEKENIQAEKPLDKGNLTSSILTSVDILSTANKSQNQEPEKNIEDRMRNDRDKSRYSKSKDKHDCEKEKSKNIKTEKTVVKMEKDKKVKEENPTPDKHNIDKGENFKSIDKNLKEKSERDSDKLRHSDDKLRHMHHRRDSKSEKDKRKELEDSAGHTKVKKDDRHKPDKNKKENEFKRDCKKESETVKSRKSSRDESTREIGRKDSTDSSTSRTSHEAKVKEHDVQDLKEDMKPKVKLTDLFVSLEKNKGFLINKDGFTKIKQENDKIVTYHTSNDTNSKSEHVKPKTEVIDKQRHHSVDSPSVDSKRKERLNSCSSLPSNIGIKRRISSQENFDLLSDESKRIKNEPKAPEQRESKDSRSGDRQKTTKFSKGHFAKIIESKTKDDKKNQVKPPDSFGEVRDSKDETIPINRPIKQSPKDDSCDYATSERNDDIHNNLGFLALLELRSSEEDEKQKALRKEMKEKKRIQQLQQIQELQMQQEVELGKMKDDKKMKQDDKKRETVRDKRMSTERKSREDKGESSKRKNRKQLQSSDSSDSDEPKKHSIFDIIDDGPTYISMYDKVKARSCKNMQKQEEEKRQEKIKAKFSQLKQSRAKREEKKRSSWDEDSDSDQDVQRKKSSLDSSDDDGSTASQNTKRHKLQCSSIEFDENKTEDYFSTPNDEDQRNKLSRKNSRTRIMSDTSDDESSKNKSMFMRVSNKLNASDSESLPTKADNTNNYCDDKITKSSLFNLFGKSDSDDSKLKSSLENENSYRPNIKSFCNDLSSECESVSSNRNVDLRRKHKKKQKKHKSSYSDEDNKIETSDTGVLDSEIKHKKLIKQRRHSSKKDKRKERIRDSIDTDEARDDNVKIRRDKKSPENIHNDYNSDIITTNTKRDGKMEDIFGPLSDESDIDSKNLNNKSDFSSLDYDSNIGLSEVPINSNEKDIKRRKDKRRKEKRWFRDDDNSLDVDAVGKAIEANLLTIADDTETIRSGTELKFVDGNMVKDIKANTQYVKLRRDSKEKRKKKKRSREERLVRKDHHYLYHPDSLDKSDHVILDVPLLDAVSNAMLLDIPLPNDIRSVDEKTDDCKSLSQSPSLPRLTESPPILIESSQDASMDVKSISSNSLLTVLRGDDNSEFVVGGKDIEIEQIPMPPPFENIVQDISEVPLPAEPAPGTINDDNLDTLKSSLTSDSDTSEEPVLNISTNVNETENIVEKLVEKMDSTTSKADKKPDEKPRAIISQEETEDAVAALLGESFGGKINTFSSYEETESSTTHQTDTEHTTLSNDNVPEEDAEEMRQAIQNLNACEMEMKPDTPVSDSDLLLIDTDTEEADETPQDAVEKAPSNVIPTQVLNNNSEQEKTVEEANTDASQKQKTEKLPVLLDHVKTTQSEPNNKNDVKIKLAKRENVQVITSTATPVITSWSLTNNKIQEPQHVLNIQSNMASNKIRTENKAAHMATNIVQIKTSQPQNVQVNNLVRPVMTQYVRPPYQVINQRPQSSNMQPRVQPPHMPRALSSNIHPRAQTAYMSPRPQPSNMQPRPQLSNMQPTTIKIPEPHILYQKSPQGIVISPRMSSDPRLQSPKTSPQAESITSPRLANMTILTSTPQNFNSPGILSPTSKLQRSPGQVTVVRMQQPPVRMQQPPLSPIQTMHGAHGPRAMMSPNKPNSVLVQGSPLHFNRLPVTPVLTPISKQINVNTTLLQNKSVGVTNMPLIQQHKNLAGGKGDHGSIIGNKNENTKIILSPTSLQHSNNPTVMAQNRLITMQNAVHLGSMNSTLHLGNKVVVSKMNPVPENRDIQTPKSMDHVNHAPFGTPPYIHVAVSHSSYPSIIQSGAKSIMSNIQETNIVNRVQQGSNVIHTLNSQRLMSPVSKNNVIQIDKSKITPSVLSMATTRPATVLTKLETPGITSASTVSHTNTLPILLQPISNIRINTKTDKDLINSTGNESKPVEEIEPTPVKKPVIEQCSNVKPLVQKSNASENISKCETDFEELLRDKTNEIKVCNKPEKKEVNVGNTTAPVTSDLQTLSEKQILKVPECDASQKAPEISSSDRAIKDFHCLSRKDDSNLANEFTSNTIQNDINTPKNIISVLPLANSIDMAIKSSETPEIKQEEKNIFPKTVSSSEKVPNLKEEIKTFDFMKEDNIEDPKTEIVKLLDNIDTQLPMNIDDDTWSVKDLNIESVIKKVDSLCNDPIDFQAKDEGSKPDSLLEIPMTKVTDPSSNKHISEPVATESTDHNIEKHNKNISVDKKICASGKRGGRSVRGKRGQKVQEKVQTRQISKPSRGTTTKRGRGRAKTDKSIKNVNNSSSPAIPGDVYDFHEDSGDETSKTETRPRLILTIKSPISGQVGVTATSTLSIAQRDQNKIAEKLNKEEKSEDFVSPSTNTRKSRRLQEKDVHRNVNDEVSEDDAGGPGLGRSAKRKPNRQAVAGKVTNANEKLIAADTRKSPRGNKRTRDRSLSDASVESADGESRKDEAIRDPKVARLDERLTQSETEPMAVARPVTLPNVPPAAPQGSHFSPLPVVAPAVTVPLTVLPVVVQPTAPLAAPTSVTLVVPPVALPTPSVVTPPVISKAPIPILPPIPTPITKPPKKMISEISAKLASAFEASAQHRASPEPARDGSPAAPATGDALAGVARRPMDCMPVGATEATDERVQSPALPHRVRVAGRATPILIRVGEGEACANAGIGALGAAGGGGGVGVGGAGRYRACGAASLPRGAHHPPPEPHALTPAPVPGPASTAVLGSAGPLPLHHHHPGAVSRITSIPKISPQGQMPLSDGMYPHFSHQHYQMYQHHFRATQHESRATHSPFTRSLEAEGSEAPQPPPELRRPPSARVPRPAHSPSTADRLIMYGRSPPPAHTSGVARVTGALPPTTAPGPPHASQVPREADSLQMLLRRYPVMWQGLLALKNDSAAVQMHFVGGSPDVAGDTLARADAGTPMLRIAQRMRLEPTQLEGVHRKMMVENEHCILLALPCGRDHMDVLLQSTNLSNGFITYLQHKQAAGIVNIAPPGHHQAMFTVHVFPSCDFANENLTRIAPDLMHRVADIAHLLIVIATV